MRRRITVDRGGTSLHATLEAVLGCGPLALAVAFGPPRPNQKPVVRAIDRHGRTVGFAKIGWTPLTASLVESEANTVTKPSLRRLHHVSLPELIHLDDWEGHRLAVYSAVMGRPGRVTPSWEAFSEVAAAWPISRQTIADSDLAVAMRGRAERLAENGDDSALTILAAAMGRWGDRELDFGGWHGDWTPWNTAARHDGGVVLWDWERAGPGVPTVFDMIHYRFQPRVTDPTYRPGRFVEEVPGWADLARILTRGEAEAAAALYLLEMSLRHAGNEHLSHLADLRRILSL